MTNSQINEIKDLVIGIADAAKYASFFASALRVEDSFETRKQYFKSSMRELDAIRDLVDQVLAITGDKEVSND